MSDSKEETNQVPTPEELATRLIPGDNMSDYWTDERREELEAAAALHSLQVEVIGTPDDPAHACYVRESDTSIGHILKIPESTINFPMPHGFTSWSSFTFFHHADTDFLKTRDLLVSQYVKDENVKAGALQEIISRRDALYESLVLSSEAIRDALTNLRPIFEFPLVMILENVGQNQSVGDFIDIWWPIAFCEEDRYHCLKRYTDWLEGIDIDIPPILKQGIIEGALYWLGVRDEILVGESIEDDHPVLFDWDDPGPQSAIERFQLWWILDHLALAAITDGEVQTDFDESPLSLLPRGDIHGNRKLSDAQEEAAIEQYFKFLDPPEDHPGSSLDAYKSTQAWVKGKFRKIVSVRKLQRIREGQVSRKGKSEKF